MGCRRSGPQARRRADRAGRALRCRRPQGRRLLGRDEAPARPRTRARARAAPALPRRADDRPRPAEPHRTVGRGRAPRHDDGVTVFLTTQYLEEADVLADRVGIIDTGAIVAEGTPDALKAEIGRPAVEAAPVEEADRERWRRALAFRGGGTGAPPVRSPCASTAAPSSWPRWCERWTPSTSPSPISRFTRPRSTTSFSPRRASALEGAGDEAVSAPTGDFEAVPA